MTRWWQFEDGKVHAGPDDVEPADDRYTEVQVVAIDALVIDRSELPEVVKTVDGKRFIRRTDAHFDHALATNVWFTNGGGWAMRAKALAYLALWVDDAHPPVDEAQVEAFAALLREALGVTPETVAAGHLRQGTSDDIARALIATGRVTVTP